ncbi:hypothetical protein E4T43_05522 [Aureobasidium subglaciale]|nr:hypothetical protein E4T43_05522 [Aureobasidium subglaciale]
MLECRARSGFHATIHRELICYFPKDYNALLKGRFSESGQKKITLRMSKYKARLLVTWLYTGHIADDVDYQNLFQLYVFADQTDILALRRVIMNQIHRNSHEKKNPGLANVAEALKVRSARTNSHGFWCFGTGRLILKDPCCEGGGRGYHCGCRNYGIKIQACCYHEHESHEGWKGQSSTNLSEKITGGHVYDR